MKTTLVPIIILGLFPRFGEATFGSNQARRIPAFVAHTSKKRNHDLRPTLLETLSPQRLAHLWLSPSCMKTKEKNHSLKNEPQQDPWSWESLQDCAQWWDLAPEETIRLQSLGEKLADVSSTHNHPMHVIRFLKEFKDEKVAEEKFRRMIGWRKENQVDKVLEEYHPPSLYRYFPAAVLRGLDLEKDPIHLERTGAADSSGLLDRYGRQEMVQQAIWLREVQCQGRWRHDYKQSQGHPVRQFTVIMDMKGLSLNNIKPSLLSVAQEVSRIVQDYYPGYTKRIFVIRAPPIFQIAYNAVKPFIDPTMKEKVTVVGEKGYCEVLAKYMDLELLPVEVCPQGKGQSVEDFDTVWQGGRIPEHEEAPFRTKGKEPEARAQTPSTVINTTTEEAQAQAQASPSHRSARNWAVQVANYLKDTFLSSIDDNYRNHPYAI